MRTVREEGSAIGAADASDLLTIVHCDEHDLFRRGLADMSSTVDDKQIATSLHLSEAALKRHLANT